MYCSYVNPLPTETDTTFVSVDNSSSGFTTSSLLSVLRLYPTEPFTDSTPYGIVLSLNIIGIVKKRYVNLSSLLL